MKIQIFKFNKHLKKINYINYNKIILKLILHNILHIILDSERS